MDLASLKGPSDVLASRVKAFKNFLELATDCLTNKDYTNAEMIYGSILADLHKDTLAEALNLNDLDLFSLHSCFAYSSVGSNFKSEQALVILNSIQKPIKLPLVPYLKAFIHISNDRISFACDELKVCQTLLDGGYNFKPNNILNEDIVPEVNDEFLKLKLNGLKFACELFIAKEDSHDLKKCFKENWLKIGKLCETDFAKWVNKEEKKEAQHDKKTKAKNVVVPAQTGAVKKKDKQVQKSKAESIAIQVSPPKGICVAVQTMEKDVNKQLLTAVLDIKNKMNNLMNKKDNEIKQLQKKVSELNDKLTAREEKREEKSSEFEFLKKQYFSLEKKHEQSLEQAQQQIHLLQKLLAEQMQHKYNMQKNIFQFFEEKCDYKIEYLVDVQQYLTPNGKLTSDECKQEIFMWKNLLNKISCSRKNFDVYYRNIDDLILTKKYSSIKANDWPGIPSIPTDPQDIIYKHYKSIIQQDNKSLFSVTYLPPPANNCATLFNGYSENYNTPNYFAYNYNTNNEDGRTTGSPTFSSMKSPKYSNSVVDNARSAASSSPSPRSNDWSIEYQSEKDLLKYLQTNFEEVDELELLQAIYHVRDMHSGTLVGFPRRLLVGEIKKFLKKTKSGKAGWSSSSTQVQWHNDHTESKCCICFDEFDNNSYSLKCQHEFHKKCITNWLKRQNACPVCRVHAVIDEEFPPLTS